MEYQPPPYREIWDYVNSDEGGSARLWTCDGQYHMEASPPGGAFDPPTELEVDREGLKKLYEALKEEFRDE